jgi:hypothetical protein
MSQAGVVTAHLDDVRTISFDLRRPLATLDDRGARLR